MYKVLIVEDEAGIRRRLVHAIDWTGMHCVVCGEADSGMAGFEKILKLRPDIVLTDIVMPGLDGITLLQYIRQKDEAVQFIFLTGYREFEYAKEALRLGAVALLTKPVDMDELKKAVLQAVYVINRFRCEDTPSDAEQGKALNALLKGQVFSAEIRRDLMRRYGLSTGTYAVCTALPDMCEEFDPLTVELLYERIRQIVKPKQLLSARIDSRHVCFFPTQAYMGRLTAEHVVKYAQQVHEQVRQELNRPLTIGVSRIRCNPDELAGAYEESRQAARDTFFYGGDGVIAYGQIGAAPDREDAVDLFLQYMEEMLLSQGAREVMAARLYALLLNMHQRDQLNAGSAKGLVVSALTCCAGKLGRADQSFYRQVFLQSDCLNALVEARSATELAGSAVDALSLMRDYITFRKSGDKQEVVAQILRFIDENYMRDISIKDAAATVFLSASYLGSILKIHTRRTFVDLLVDARISRARQLLSQEGARINEIAALTGFKDAHYFSQVFKKITGLTPTEFMRYAHG
jgi:two-component system response regulator YesN